MSKYTNEMFERDQAAREERETREARERQERSEMESARRAGCG